MHVEKWVKEDIQRLTNDLKNMKQINKIAKCRKILIKPTKLQIKQLNNFINDCRYTYNKGIELFNSDNSIYSFFNLRNYLVTKKTKKELKHIVNIPDEIFNTPKHMRSEEIKVLATNIKSAFSNLKNKNITHFKMRFKSKKTSPKILNCEHHASSIKILNDKQYLKLTNIQNPILINTKELINLENDFKIQCSKNNKWYLLVTYYDDIKENKQYNICALDPGLRKFMTGIDINANKFKIGDGIMQILSKLKIKISNLQSSLHKLNNKRKNLNSKKLYNKWNKCKQMLITSHEKFKFKIKELHYQTCNYLCKKYDVIILPNFGVKEMIAKSSKWLRKSILQLSFCEFKERLKNKCKEYNKTFILTEEPYSSKTCSLCENYNFNISKEEQITCNFCKKKYNRDENGALNILKNTLNGVFKSKII